MPCSTTCALGHASLDASSEGELSLLDQLAAPEAEPAISEAMNGLALEQLEISTSSVMRAQKKAIAALRLQF
ncbi:MAG: hypothetical protein R6W06_05095 [Prochlorococcaceae cyanobacterium]